MPRGSQRRSGGRGRSSRRRGYWDGIQFPSTAIQTSGVVFVLVGSTATEFMPATCVSIRGWLWWQASGTAADVGAVQVYNKIMLVEVNDAQTMSGDHQAQDTHEEDIAQRQLWTYATQLPRAKVDTQETENEVVRIEINVRVSIKLPSHGKKLLVLLADSSIDNRANMGGYLRCYLRHN